MDYRKLLILKELIGIFLTRLYQCFKLKIKRYKWYCQFSTGYNSDIICLQEVDSSVYENDLQMSLSILNYSSIYNLKNDLREGLAIFYNQDRFDQLSCDYKVISQGIHLDEFNTVWTQIQNSRVKQTFLNRNTIIQVLE